MAALLGGFALGNLQGGKVADEFLDLAIYMCNVIAVHACTCSCLMSAFLYQKANGLPEADVTAWALKNKWMLTIPMHKFAGGCVCYLISVVLLSFRDLEGNLAARYMAMVVGIMSVMMVFATAIYINTTSRPNNFFKVAEQDETEMLVGASQAAGNSDNPAASI